MTSIVSTIQKIIEHELRNMRVAELGLVEQVYPHQSESDNDNYGCDVRLKDNGLLLKRVPIATGHIGTAGIPNIGDLVLLTFDNGDVNQPIVIGRLYNDEDRPPLNKPDEIIFRLPLAEPDDKTVKAAVRNISNNKPPREILIEMAPKITVRIADGKIQTTAGKTEMVIDQSGESGGKVTVVSGRTTMTMNQDGDITIEAAGGISLKATGDLKLEGTNVNIKGNMKTNIEAGTEVSVKGSMSATVEGGLSSTLQGTNVTIKGLTSFSM